MSGVLNKGGLVEYGIISTDKNWHRAYVTLYHMTTTASISLTAGAFFVISKEGYNTTFSDFSGQVTGWSFGAGTFSATYEYSTIYRTIGGSYGFNFSVPTATGAYLKGNTTYIGQPYYYEDADPDPRALIH